MVDCNPAQRKSTQIEALAQTFNSKFQHTHSNAQELVLTYLKDHLPDLGWWHWWIRHSRFSDHYVAHVHLQSTAIVHRWWMAWLGGMGGEATSQDIREADI